MMESEVSTYREMRTGHGSKHTGPQADWILTGHSPLREAQALVELLRTHTEASRSPRQ